MFIRSLIGFAVLLAVLLVCRYLVYWGWLMRSCPGLASKNAGKLFCERFRSSTNATIAAN